MARVRDWRDAVKARYEMTLHASSMVSHSVYKLFVIGLSPSGMSEQMAEAIQNASQTEQDALLERFIQTKHLELGTIVISCALVASLAGTLLSWNWFPVPPYPARVAMLGAILHSLAGLAIASQQYIVLTRIDLYPKRSAMVRDLVLGMSSSPGGNNGWTAGKLTHIAWQIPIMLLGSSVVFVIVALAIAVFAEAQRVGGWNSETITAVAFAICMLFTTGCYFTSWICIECRVQTSITNSNLNV